MSYVRGFGQFYTGAALPAVSTMTPTQSTGSIPASQPAPVPMLMSQAVFPPQTPTEPIDRTPPPPATVLMSGNYPVCRDPNLPKKDGWGWENGKSCKQLNYPFCASAFDKAGTGWGWENNKSCIVPIFSSPPPATYNEPYEAGGQQEISISPSGQIQSPVNTGYQPPAFPGSEEGESPYEPAPAQAAAGSVTPTTFAAVCQQVGGKLGPNCCALPDGTAVGLQAGQMVPIASCSASAANIPLIAGAAIAAALLLRVL